MSDENLTKDETDHLNEDKDTKSSPSSSAKDPTDQTPEDEKNKADDLINNDEPVTLGAAIAKGFKETIDTFKAFIKAPKEII